MSLNRKSRKHDKLLRDQLTSKYPLTFLDQEYDDRETYLYIMLAGTCIKNILVVGEYLKGLKTGLS